MLSFIIKLINCSSNLRIISVFFLIQIKRGDKIFKYGEIIGVAIDDIDQGNLVHTHNIQSLYHNDKEFLN